MGITPTKSGNLISISPSSTCGQLAVIEISPLEIDEYGELDRWWKETAQKRDRREELGSQIRKSLATCPPDESRILEGSLWKVQASERSEERKLDLAGKLKVFRKLGKRAMEFFSITLKAAENELGKTYVDSIVSVEKTGYRKLVAFPSLEQSARARIGE